MAQAGQYSLTQFPRKPRKIHDSQIKVLPDWGSYDPASRADFQKALIKMLKTTRTTFLLTNVSILIDEAPHPGVAQVRALDAPFTPGPLRKTTTLVVPVQVYTPSPHAHATAYPRAHARTPSRGRPFGDRANNAAGRPLGDLSLYQESIARYQESINPRVVTDFLAEPVILPLPGT